MSEIHDLTDRAYAAVERARSQRVGVKRETLSDGDIAALRRPFAVVKFMPQGKVLDFSGRKTCRFLAHIDSSLVVERLHEVDPAWSAEYERLGSSVSEWTANQHATVCRLTVRGVTREEIGYGGRTEPMKAAYSDALKRAALRFGVGAYLRDSGWEFWMDAQIKDATGRQHDAYTVKRTQSGEVVGYLKPAGRAFLQAEYDRIVGRDAFVRHYGEVVQYGDVDLEQDDALGQAEADAPDVLAPVEVDVLVLLGRATGRRTSEATLRARYAQVGMRFDAELTKVLASLQSTKALTASDTDALRVAAGHALEGNAPDVVADALAGIIATKEEGS